MQGLAEKGFGREQLAEMQKIIDAEKSDLFDVLAHVAYALPPLTREERADTRQGRDQHALQQQAAGLPRLRAVALRERRRGGTRLRRSSRRLLRLKYHNSIADAVADLGKPEEIGKVFTGFQKYLYNKPLKPTSPNPDIIAAEIVEDLQAALAANNSAVEAMGNSESIREQETN